ncbi:MAG: hypothetical protein K6F56_11075 [Oscillospiraceae bacterium]|nr:hypothetical protein [Oscillospiraceae bacterium]
MTLHRKLSALVPALLLALLAACAGPSTPAAPAAEVPAPAAEPTGPFSPAGSVLFDRDGVKVTTDGLDFDPSSGDADPIVWLKIENTGDRERCLGVAEGVVNGVMADVTISEYEMENGVPCYTNQAFSLPIPAGGSGRYGLGYYKNRAPGLPVDTLAEMAFRFTLAESEYDWPYYASAPVTIVTGETAEDADLASLGTVVLDDDRLTLVIGAQDYDDFMGPTVYVYAENKSGDWLGLSADSAEADGVSCDYILYGDSVAPGRKCAAFMSFDGEMQAMKGFEKLTLGFRLREAATKDELDTMFDGEALTPVSVQYPPQNWGKYENGGLRLEVKPKYNDLITVETPADDAKGILFIVSETASLEAGGHEGAGLLFSIGTVSEERLHEMLRRDMSGARVFAKDEDGTYYMYYHPTDVRYERATVEEMKRDAPQWSMLCEWANSVPDSLRDLNGLEDAQYGNTELDMYLARAAWMDGVNASLSTTEFGPVKVGGVDGAPYADAVMHGYYAQVDAAETPDGEYVVLSFPDDDVRLDFFFAPGNYARLTSNGNETLYQAMFYDEDVSCAEFMRDWYHALAEQAGLKSA